MHFHKTISALAILLMLGTASARADYDAAYAALQKKDYPTAASLMKEAADTNDPNALYGLGLMYWNGIGLEKNPAAAIQWMEKAATAGNPASMNMLAHVYLKGDQVEKNIDTARRWAQESVNTGDAKGQFLFYAAARFGPEWNYKDSAGKIDMAKYAALARRPLAERSLDRQAYTALSKAAEQGLPQAKIAAMAALLENIAPDNKKRLLEFLHDSQNVPETLLQNKLITEKLLQLGESYTNAKVFKNASTTVFVSVALATAKFDPLKNELKNETCKAADLRITKTSISRPLSNAVYLPVQAKLLKDSYLISGSWQETWTVDACGIPVFIPIEFQADGFGGAYFQIASKPEDRQSTSN